MDVPVPPSMKALLEGNMDIAQDCMPERIAQLTVDVSVSQVSQEHTLDVTHEKLSTCLHHGLWQKLWWKWYWPFEVPPLFTVPKRGEYTSTGHKNKGYSLAEIRSTCVPSAWPRSLQEKCHNRVVGSRLQCRR